ncbi:MAG: hypothetical protein Kow0099_07750 [Candidatus Abyssubacteria bacterium]
MSQKSGSFASLQLLAIVFVLSASGPALAMPPHPTLLEKFRIGELKTPGFISNPDSLKARGINQAGAEPDLRSISLYPAPPVTGPTGTFKALALLVDFSDKVKQVQASYFDTLIFGTTGSTVRNYYGEVSYGSLTIVTVHLPSSTGWLRAPQPYSYYTNGQYGLDGPYPNNAQKLVEDVVDAANAAVDFSQYDNDGDTFVDALFVIHAGPGAEFTGSPNDIWSHQWAIWPRLKDGVYINVYSMEPEYWLSPGDMTAGVYCHELGHVFGLPDLYDTDYSSAGVGEWSIMSFGSWNGLLGGSPAHPDAWSRIRLGFASPTIVATNTTGLSIPAVENQPHILYVWNSGSANNEYFLVENRQKIGYDAALPGSGLLIWHVDGSKFTNDNECLNLQNCNCANHFQVALEQADGQLHLEKNYYGDAGDPFPGSYNKRTFDATTAPNSGSYLNCTSSVAIRNISNSAATMTADISVGITDTLTSINLSAPPNQSTVTSPPTFRWTPDGGANNAFAVELSLSPTFSTYWSTYKNFHQAIMTTSWTMTPSQWAQVPAGRSIYWRVRGMDLHQTPRSIVTSQVWSFYKP